MDVGEPVLIGAWRAHSVEVACCDVLRGWLTTAGGRQLRVWRWQPGQGWQEHAANNQAHRFGVTAVRWAGSGVLLASAGVDGAVRVWSRSLAALQLLVAPAAPAVRALCWAGGRLLAGYDDGALVVWAVKQELILARLTAHENALYAVAAPARSALLLTACTNGVLKVFDLPKVIHSGGGSVAPLAWVDGAHDMGALCAAASDDGALAATGGHDARIALWRSTYTNGVRGMENAGWLEGHAAAVTGLSWARGALLGSAALDRTARLWRVQPQATCLRVLPAHARYLTCLNLQPDLQYMLTGSNDKTIRMWSMGSLSLDEELAAPCEPSEHFALGDLEGIAPVDDEIDETEDIKERGSQRLWVSSGVHSGAINSIAAYRDMFATACSDGAVRVWSWDGVGQKARLVHALECHRYPAMAVDVSARSAPATLLSAGLDSQAVLTDLQSGVRLRSVCCEGVCGEEGGGSGVRGARLSPHRPPLLLLATDDNIALLYAPVQPDPVPLHVYNLGGGEGTLCCAWTWDGAAACVGSAGGEIRVLTPPPRPAVILTLCDAHDLGVQCCDFAPREAASELQDHQHLLVSGGCDSLIKLWRLDLTMDDFGAIEASLTLLSSVSGHGGGTSCVRWGMGEAASLLASSGADQWARVWRLQWDRRELMAMAAVPAGPAPSAALLSQDTLAVGTLTGDLEVWQVLGSDEANNDTLDADQDAGIAPRLWSFSGVKRWLQDYITRPPGCGVCMEEESLLLQRARVAELTGARLLDDDLTCLVELLGYGDDIIQEGVEGPEKDEAVENRISLRARLLDELRWLRCPPPTPQMEAGAPEWARCVVTHRVLVEPARAADGLAYERSALTEWFLANDGGVSYASGKRLRNSNLAPNYALRARLRAFYEDHQNKDENEY